MPSGSFLGSDDGTVIRYDFRLATIAAGIWGGTWLAARIPATATWVVLGIGVAVCCAVWRRPSTAVPVALVMGFAAGLAVTVPHVLVAEEVKSLPPVEEGRIADIDVTVENDPKLLQGMREPTYLMPVRVHRIRAGDTAWVVDTAGVLFAVESNGGNGDGSSTAATSPEPTEWAGLLPGQRMTVTGRMAAVKDRPGDLAAITVWSRHAAVAEASPPWWQDVAGAMREAFRSACAGLPPGPAGLLPGLVVGDVSNTPQEITEDFRATGMSHLVAVSGSNVAVVVGAVLLLAGGLGVGPRGRTVVGCATIVAFAVLARPEPSVLRASVMAAVGLIAIGWGRRGAAVPSVAAAVVVLLPFAPELASDLGFALSVAATLGLVLLAGRWTAAWRARGWPSWLAMAVAVPLAAQLAVTPLLAAWEGRISLVAVVANALAAPAVPIATILGLLCCMIAAWWLDAAQVLAWLASWPTRWLIVVADHGAAVPVGQVSWPRGWLAALVLAALLLAGMWLARRRWGRFVVVAVLVLALVASTSPVRTMFRGWPPTGWLMVACDVGQGDALVLSTGEPGTAIVVDTGMDPEPIDACLTELGVTRIPLLIISHFHADHVAGVAGVMRNRDVGQLVAPHGSAPMGGVRILTEAIGVDDAPTTAVGTIYTVGAVTVTVLLAGGRFSGTRSDPNNDSIVVLAEQAGVRTLLTGDIEEDGQRYLVDSGMDISADILKVPHHGSGYFEPDFFAEVAPTVAVVSVGADNDYGHPHRRVLSELIRLEAVVVRTDKDGTVALVGAEDGLRISRR